MSKFLIYVLLVSLSLNLALTAFNVRTESRFTDPDSKDYLKLADNIAAGNGYTKGAEPEIFRAPGYPVFLAPFRYLFPQTVLPIIIIQCFIATFSLLLLWHLALSISGGNTLVAKTAVLLQAISLSSIVYANKILSETLFTSLLLLAFFLLDKMVNILKSDNKNATTEEKRITDKKVYILAFSTGIICGFLLLTRAIFLPIFPVFLIYVWLQSAPSIRIKRSKKIYISIALIILPYLAAFGGWSTRNSITAGYNGFSSVASINIYRYYACAVLAKQNGRTFTEQQAICDANLAKLPTEVDKAKYSIKHGLPILKSSPIRYIFLHLKSDINTLLPAVGDFYAMLGQNIGGKGTLGVINTQGIIAGVKHYFAGNWGLFMLAIPLIVVLAVKYMSALTGCITEVRPGHLNITAALYLIFLLYMITAPGLASHPRFRVPIEPILAIFAGIGLSFIISLIQKKRAARSN